MKTDYKDGFYDGIATSWTLIMVLILIIVILFTSCTAPRITYTEVKTTGGIWEETIKGDTAIWIKDK